MMDVTALVWTYLLSRKHKAIRRKNWRRKQSVKRRKAFARRQSGACLIHVHAENDFVELASAIIQTIWCKEHSSHWWEHVVNTTFTPRLVSNFRMSRDTFLHFCDKLKAAI